MLKVFSSCLLILLLITASAMSKPVYDFKLQDFDGSTVQLSDFKGKVVLLDFWASWCAPCKRAFPYLVSLNKKYGDDDFLLVGVNVDRKVDLPKFKKLLDYFKVDYLNVVGTNIGVRYGVSALPTTILLNPAMEEEARFIGLTRQSEKKLENKIQELLYKKEQPVYICLDYFKVFGDNVDSELGDDIRRSLFKSLNDYNPKFRINFSVPGDTSNTKCHYSLSGSLSANAGKGRLVVTVYDGENGLELDNASEFGKLETINAMVDVLVSRIGPKLVNK